MKTIPRRIWISRFAWVGVGTIYGLFVDAPPSVRICMAMIVAVAIAFVPTRKESDLKEGGQ